MEREEGSARGSAAVSTDVGAGTPQGGAARGNAEADKDDGASSTQADWHSDADPPPPQPDAHWSYQIQQYASPCMMNVLTRLWPTDAGGLAGATGESLFWLVSAIALKEDAFTGLRVRDVAMVVSSAGANTNQVVLGSLVPTDPTYLAAYDSYLTALTSAVRQEPLRREFVLRALRLLVDECYTTHFGARAGISGQAASGPAPDQALAGSLGAVMQQLANVRPASVSSTTAADKGFPLSKMQKGLAAFTNATTLVYGLSQVASPKAVKALFEGISSGDGFPLAHNEERAAIWNLVPWASPDGALTKEKQDKLLSGVDGQSTVSQLDTAFAADCRAMDVIAKYELFFNTVHVLACLWQPDQKVITLRAYPVWIRSMRDCVKEVPGHALNACVLPLFTAAIDRVNSSVGAPVPVTFDEAFEPSALKQTLVGMRSLWVGRLNSGLGSSGVAAGTQPTQSEAAPGKKGKGGKSSEDQLARHKRQIENQQRQIENLKRSRGTGASVKVRGGMDDSQWGECTRIFPGGRPCGNNDLCNRCHKHKDDWVAQASR